MASDWHDALPDLGGKVALVTGASRGIGAAIAELAAERGADVALVARSAGPLSAVADGVQKRGRRAAVIAADLASAEAAAVVAQAELELGPIDLLVNNAALLEPLAPLWLTDRAEWERNVEVNLFAPVRLMRVVMAAMIKRGSGRVVNVSSGLAREPLLAWSAYGAGKAGLDQVTRVVGAEAAPHGVGVAALWPGNVDTEMQAQLRRHKPEDIDPADHARFMRYKAEGTLRSTEEAARFTLWVAGLPLEEMAGKVFNIRTAAPLD